MPTLDISLIKNKKKEVICKDLIDSVLKDSKKEKVDKSKAKLKNDLQNQSNAKNSNLILIDEPLSKNEYKVINAIRSEAFEQNIQEPIIGRTIFMRKYKIGPNYLSKSIESLLGRGIISFKEVPYSTSQNTKSWKLLK